MFAEDIDIFDRMALQVKYDGGITMNYSLVAYAPEEGPRIRFVGSNGTVEFEYFSSGPRAYSKRGTTFLEEIADRKVTGEKEGNIVIRVLPADGEEEIVLTSFGRGAHGGADDVMRDDIFRAPNPDDDLCHVAPSVEAYYSLAIGDMAVMSNRLGRPVKIDELP